MVKIMHKYPAKQMVSIEDKIARNRRILLLIMNGYNGVKIAKRMGLTYTYCRVLTKNVKTYWNDGKYYMFESRPDGNKLI